MADLNLRRQAPGEATFGAVDPRAQRAVMGNSEDAIQQPNVVPPAPGGGGGAAGSPSLGLDPGEGALAPIPQSFDPGPQGTILPGAVGLKFQRIGMALLGQADGTGGRSTAATAANRDAIANINNAIKISDQALALVDDRTSPEQLETTRDRINMFQQGAGDVFITAATRRIKKLGHAAQVAEESPTLRNLIDLSGADIGKTMEQLEKNEGLRDRVLTEVGLNQERKLIPGVANKLGPFMERARERMGKNFEAMRKETGFFDIDDVNRMNDVMRDSGDGNKTERLSTEEMLAIDHNANAFEEFGIRGASDLGKRVKDSLGGDFRPWIYPNGDIQAIRKGSRDEDIAAEQGAFPGSLNANSQDELKSSVGLLGNKSVQEFGEAAAAVKGVYRLANRVQVELAKSVTASTWLGGDLPGMINDVYANAKAIRKDFLGEEEDLEFGFEGPGGFHRVSEREFFNDMEAKATEEGLFDPLFRRMGAQAEHKALITSDLMKLAFLGAAASEKGGRFTDRDISSQLEILAKNQDAKIMAKGLNKYKADVIVNFVNRAEGFNVGQESIAEQTGKPQVTLRADRYLGKDLIEFANKFDRSHRLGDLDTINPQEIRFFEPEQLLALSEQSPDMLGAAIGQLLDVTPDGRTPSFRKDQLDALVKIVRNNPILSARFQEFMQTQRGVLPEPAPEAPPEAAGPALEAESETLQELAPEAAPAQQTDLFLRPSRQPGGFGTPTPER